MNVKHILQGEAFHIVVSVVCRYTFFVSVHFVFFIAHSAWPFLGYTKCYSRDVTLLGQTRPWALLFLSLPLEECSV